MTKSTRLLAGVICVLGGALVVIAFALFNGYFDHGRFVVKEAAWSPLGPARVAVVAERSDHQALSSDVYFVLMGDHVFSPAELRTAYHGDHVIFAAASDCLSVQWRGPNNLAVICRNGTIDSNHIDVHKLQAGDVAITYVNISDANSVAK
jgi:hypothetical protein